MQRYTVPTVEVPEDVLADDGQLTAETRLATRPRIRRQASSTPPRSRVETADAPLSSGRVRSAELRAPIDAVLEDTVSELDREARLKEAERELELSEGRLPADGHY